MSADAIRHPKSRSRSLAAKSPAVASVSRLAEPAPQRGTVLFDRAMPGIVVITLRGRHNAATWPQIEAALQRTVAVSHLLVDLTECTHIDGPTLAGILRAPQAAGRLSTVDVVAPRGGVCAAACRDQFAALATGTIHRARPHALAAVALRRR